MNTPPSGIPAFLITDNPPPSALLHAVNAQKSASIRTDACIKIFINYCIINVFYMKNVYFFTECNFNCDLQYITTSKTQPRKNIYAVKKSVNFSAEQIKRTRPDIGTTKSLH
ncbi:hypothetical protein Tsp_07910 [Trichinella spiralis]|uniref:hypothetical protein n=1 Tax=Trichinella spiralis TaxID=6334 RepID=UPI0001EFB482|nr:hypothetical protein Tsp_07910 [Trichinella spiralis]